ncbi:MAG TPA: NUDIX hydrolase [Longimicrobiales bacterium]|nr:NUDIX hydrolase [Longimicrobiales bacterium]
MSDRAARLDRRVVHDGRVVRLSIDTVRFPDGRTGTLELIEHAGAAAILPLLDPPDATDPRALVLRQYRYAGGGYLIEVPAGTRDSQEESFETCAHRELEEETGYRAGRLEPLGEILTTPGFTDERIALFLAWDLAEGASSPDAEEYLRPMARPLSELLDDARAGAIPDAKTLCTLFLADAWRRARMSSA